jgi:hypothetical protein
LGLSILTVIPTLLLDRLSEVLGIIIWLKSGKNMTKIEQAIAKLNGLIAENDRTPIGGSIAEAVDLLLQGIADQQLPILPKKDLSSAKA